MVELSNSSELNWYAIHTRSKCEKVVQKAFCQKFEIYLPMHWVKRRWSDRYKKLLVPLIPSYVFVKMTLSNRLDVLSNTNVLNIISNKGKITPIPAKEMELVRKIEESKIPFEYVNKKHPFSLGEKVEILKGAFFGIEGEIEAFLNQNWVSIHIPSIGGSFKTEIKNLSPHYSTLSLENLA